MVNRLSPAPLITHLLPLKSTRKCNPVIPLLLLVLLKPLLFFLSGRWTPEPCCLQTESVRLSYPTRHVVFLRGRHFACKGRIGQSPEIHVGPVEHVRLQFNQWVTRRWRNNIDSQRDQIRIVRRGRAMQPLKHSVCWSETRQGRWLLTRATTWQGMPRRQLWMEM